MNNNRNTLCFRDSLIFTIIFLSGGSFFSLSLKNITEKNAEKNAVIKEGVVFSNDLENIEIDTNNDGKFSEKDGDIVCHIEEESNTMKRKDLKTAFNIEVGDRLIIEMPSKKDKRVYFQNIKAINDKQITENFISNKNKKVVATKLNEKERS